MDSIDELFAEVYEHPEDDQVRRVLADALLAAGDPRGELILFQLEPERDYHRRAMRLIQAHGLRWLHELEGLVIPLAYERGFLAAAQLIPDHPFNERSFDAPMWATVHTIDLGALPENELVTFRITPAMRSLRTLTGVAPAHLELLRSRQPEALARLEIVLREEPGGPGELDDVYDVVGE